MKILILLGLFVVAIVVGWRLYSRLSSTPAASHAQVDNPPPASSAESVNAVRSGSPPSGLSSRLVGLITYDNDDGKIMVVGAINGSFRRGHILPGIGMIRAIYPDAALIGDKIVIIGGDL